MDEGRLGSSVPVASVRAGDDLGAGDAQHVARASDVAALDRSALGQLRGGDAEGGEDEDAGGDGEATLHGLTSLGTLGIPRKWIRAPGSASIPRPCPPRAVSTSPDS